MPRRALPLLGLHLLFATSLAHAEDMPVVPPPPPPGMMQSRDIVVPPPPPRSFEAIPRTEPERLSAPRMDEPRPESDRRPPPPSFANGMNENPRR